jgi:excisionase family DNA binding protein
VSKLLTVTEVAERLNVSLPTVRQLIDSGHLRAVMIPGATQTRRIRRVAIEALEHFLKDHETLSQ